MKRILYLAACAITFFGFTTVSSAQERPRFVKTISSQPVNQPPVSNSVPDRNKSLSTTILANAPGTRPVLTNNISVYNPLIKKTGSSSPVNAMASLAAAKMAYAASTSMTLLHGIQARMGIPYLYGSSGPNRYDCSGFVWSVFNEAGIDFARSNVRTLWAMSEPVTGDERFKFGTLIFLNGLGHMGIVADDKGFYHASSSQGITYSTFEGYWASHIVGFRRLPATIAPLAIASAK
ncbi:MAG: C40 family peptidase [Pyrinomonadaceae bacterium]